MKEEIERILMNNFTRGDIKTATRQLSDLFALSAMPNNILGLDNPYPLHIVLEKLKWATNYLLHKKNYDGHGYEELNQCVRRAEEIISCLKELNFNHISIKSFLIWLEKEGGNSFIDKDALIDNYLQSRKIKK